VGIVVVIVALGQSFFEVRQLSAVGIILAMHHIDSFITDAV
jgi:hypothetical protein